MTELAEGCVDQAALSERELDEEDEADENSEVESEEDGPLSNPFYKSVAMRLARRRFFG